MKCYLKEHELRSLIKEMREHPEKQAIGTFYIIGVGLSGEPIEQYCVLGLAAHLAGFKNSEVGGGGLPDLIGDREFITKVMDMNDGGKSYEYPREFSEIADWLESTFLPEEHGPIGVRKEERECLKSV